MARDRFDRRLFAWILLITGFMAVLIGYFGGSGGYDYSEGVAVSVNVAGSAADFCNGLASSSAGAEGWSWFLIGAWVSVALFFVLTIMMDGRRKKK